MPSKVLLALVVVTVLALVGAFVAVQSSSGTASTEQGRLFSDLDINRVARLTLDANEGDLDLRDEDGTWVVENGYPAKFDQVKKTLVAISELDVVEEKTSNPERYARIGVQDPGEEPDPSVEGGTRLLTLADREGNTVASLIIGKTEPGGRAYVRIPGEATSWLVEGDLSLSASRTTWLETEILAIGRERVMSTVIEHSDETVVIERASPEDTNFVIANLPDDREPLRVGAGNNAAYALSYVALTDVAPASEIDFTDAVRGTWELRNTMRIVVETRQEEDHAWIRIEALVPSDAPDEVTDEAGELNARLGGWAFRIAAFKAGYLAERMERLTKEKPESALGPEAPWDEETPPPAPTGEGG